MFGEEGTALQAETIAIASAATLLLESKLRGKRIELRTDSRSALVNMSRTTVSDVYTRQAIAFWEEVALTNEVILRWIPSKTCDGNKRADALAKEAATYMTSKTRIFLNNKQIRAVLKEAGDREWAKAWRHAEHEEPKYWIPTIDQKKTDEMLRWDKKTLSKVIQYLSGFNNLRNHVGRVNKTSRICRLCLNGKEDSIHLSRACPATETKWIEEDWNPEEIKQLLEKTPIESFLMKRS